MASAMVTSLSSAAPALSFSSSLNQAGKPTCQRSSNKLGADPKKCIRCEASSDEEGFYTSVISTGRRQALISLTSIGAAATVFGSPVVEEAQAADLIERIQRGEFLTVVKEKLRNAVNEKPELVPALLRLAINDALTYDKATNTGGANGSIHFSEELSRPENAGLEGAVELLASAKEAIDAETKGGPISWADLIQFGGQAAVKRSFLTAAIAKAGGDEKKGRTLIQAFGSDSQWGFFDKQLGRKDAEGPDPAGRIPIYADASVEELKAKLAPYGLKARQLAVLSACLGPDQLAVEAKLATDPETKPFVDKYQKSRQSISQTDYEVDLITTFTKIAQFGAPINYEAYTYPRPKRNIRF